MRDCKVVTICTTRFNVKHFYVLPTQILFVFLHGSQNKRRLFPYTALNNFFCNREAFCLLCGTE